MPTGTRSSIRMNRLTNPMIATASALMTYSTGLASSSGFFISSGWKISR
jgi:hypothetical protein